MSVLVFIDNNKGSFKKNAFETINYGKAIADKIGGETVALVLGTANNSELEALGAYGAQKVLHIADARLDTYNTKAFGKAIVAAVNSIGAKAVITSYNVTGKSVAGYVAAGLGAGLVSGAVDYPDTSNGFVVKKTVFSGKAYAHVKVNTDVKVISLVPNTFGVNKSGGNAAVEAFSANLEDADFGITLKEVKTVSGDVPLGEAELVVSGGRGLKGPENWGIVEDLAKSLGAALACSRPVADAHWRPHHEHVGQTGGTIRPNLYIAAGISGAIQHLAGVNSSKCIVVINKDPEAPFFKSADYGIVGDVFEVLPKLTEAVNKFKSSQA